MARRRINGTVQPVHSARLAFVIDRLEARVLRAGPPPKKGSKPPAPTLHLYDLEVRGGWFKCLCYFSAGYGRVLDPDWSVTQFYNSHGLVLVMPSSELGMTHEAL